jgi:LPS export ABC transporter permease LptG
MRYLMRELATPSLLGLLLYMFVLLMNHFFLVAEKALSKNLPPELTLRLLLVAIPKLLILAIPMAVLLGTLIGLGRISADHEWVALQAAGQGPGAVLGPVLLHGLIAATASFLIYAIAIPRTHYATRTLSSEVLFSSNLAADLRPRVFYELPDNALMYADEIRPGGDQRLENVILVRTEPGPRPRTKLIVARFGDLYPAPDGTGALLVDLYDGEFRQFRTDEPDRYLLTRFTSHTAERIEPFSFLRSLSAPPSKVAGDLTMGELADEIRQARAERAALIDAPPSARTGRQLLADRRLAAGTIELHRRLAVPAAALCLAILAVPLGLTTARSGKGAGFALSVVVVVLYRVIFVTSCNQALNGRIPAALGPWVANGLVLTWAAVALVRLRGRTVGSAAWPLAVLWAAIARRIRRLVPSRRRPGVTDATPTAPAAGNLATLGGNTRRFVGRLDRYVGLAFLRVFGLALASTYLIYAVVEGQELADRAVRTSRPLGLVVRYLVYFAPGILNVVLPIACLLGAVSSITLLSRSSELVAIRAAGVSMRRATLPILVLTTAFGGLLFLVQDRLAPGANREAQELKDRIENRAPRTHGLPASGSWRFGTDGGNLYHFRLHDPETDVYQGLSVFTIDRSGPRIVGHRFSERAQFVKGTWLLDRGWHRDFVSPEPGDGSSGAHDFHSTLTRHDQPYQLDLDLPANLTDERLWLGRRADNLPEQVNVAELRERIDSLRNSGNDITRLHVAYHRRFAEAAAPLVMVLLGLPFAFRVGRRGSLYGIGVALMLVLVYWATFAVFNALGLETLLPAPVAAWAPNALYGLLGTYLLLYVRT